MTKKTVEVCHSPLLFPLFSNENTIVVVIDVLRATSAICTAFHHGVDRIIPVATVEEAAAYRSKGYIAAAERQGEMVEGFDLGNSPFSYMNEQIKGKTVILTTTNGTQAIEVSKKSSKVVIGSFLNLDALSQWLAGENKNILLLCSGWKNKFNLEDTLFAGAVTQQLSETGTFEIACDSAIAAQRLYELAKNDLYGFLEHSSHRNRLRKLNLDKDTRYCLTPNQTKAIPVLEGESLVLLKRTDS